MRVLTSCTSTIACRRLIQSEDFTRLLDCRTQEPRDVAGLMRLAQTNFFEQIPVSELINKVVNVRQEIQEWVKPLPDFAPAKPKVEKRKSSDNDQMKLF